MVQSNINEQKFHTAFLASARKHILMITNHGIHQWKVIPGLPDTGGQNVFVNHFTETLAEQGFKITIVNRGGYTHPQTAEPLTGMNYKDENQRIVYIEDGKSEFVRKEDMNEQIPALVEDLKQFLSDQEMTFDLIISHYWDAAKLGIELNQSNGSPVPHIWVPHSLGAVKKRNMEESQWEDLRIDERIAHEKEIMKLIDGAAATSSLIGTSMKEDYDRPTDIFLPPCVNAERYSPREIPASDPIWEFLAESSGTPSAEIQKSMIITEISRTDKTKRKDVVIKSFAKVLEAAPESFLIVSIDENQPALHSELQSLIDELGVRARTAVVGSIWDKLPSIYGVSSIYCTPSVMEGFGMSIQEAAATRVPAVSSSLVPFAKEYLLGKKVEKSDFGGKISTPVEIGEGAIVVQPDDVEGFAAALTYLATDESARKKMAESAYSITIPYFTWPSMVENFLKSINVSA